MRMKINNRHSSVLKSQMESILHFVAECVSLEEMKALQGVCMLTSMWAGERQYEGLLSDLDDQVWRDLSDDLQKYLSKKRRKHRPANQSCVQKSCQNKRANFRLKTSVIKEVLRHCWQNRVAKRQGRMLTVCFGNLYVRERSEVRVTILERRICKTPWHLCVEQSGAECA